MNFRRTYIFIFAKKKRPTLRFSYIVIFIINTRENVQGLQKMFYK